ncbi:uncharacterized protein LOC128547665 [Mercenaria mercenaria]|uniref:uncharacterized protein LOC128547665 n=1 Tax=Mercenaria mercenaria TaxID=6596 RepID=UPI00234F4186|nr:uncharacterized protein LOC128547665 [Mercenaria mercenaria]
MFRNFYAEQNMADPRDSWYKPNLLYNIHYKPPIPPTPPKMIVITREFNPSVCTCGEHGCDPHYRMEKEVVWSSKKARNEAERELKEDIQAERGAKAHRELKEDIQAERIAKAHRELKEDIQAERITKAHRELNEDIQAERGAKVHREPKEDIQAERGTKPQKEGIVGVDDDSGEDEIEDDGPKSKDDEEWKVKNDTTSRCSDRDDLFKSFPRVDDLSQHTDVLHTSDTSVELEEADNEDFGSAFGIMSVYCDSELHTWKNELTDAV